MIIILALIASQSFGYTGASSSSSSTSSALANCSVYCDSFTPYSTVSCSGDVGSNCQTLVGNTPSANGSPCGNYLSTDCTQYAAGPRNACEYQKACCQMRLQACISQTTSNCSSSSQSSSSISTSATSSLSH